ncbi:DUF4272 domain-containing protein [Aquidulcibacter sp.]|uniref:DUF4272 domain-containing protein n=1 Tax=Aquidulcibacter sp. TaxID=2052990 RepID=UPI0025BB7749|nr:DUF4272 domain-containing protein [Aquidulcibacter sp.]MCA3692717.1 DUF4272 domain-containing protein [Aquidulcibacter sp.]
MVIDDIRDSSRSVLTAHGLFVPDGLPALDVANLRSFREILNRLFCLNAVAATSYGLDSTKAISWLHQEQLDEELTQPERCFLEHGKGDRDAFKVQIEGMWALAWAVNIVPEIDFWRDCNSGFVTLLPNLKTGESVTRTMGQAELRASDQIIAACDLSYCLHWIIREALIKGDQFPPDLKPYVVIERRRALEWMFSEDAWDMVSLDT